MRNRTGFRLCIDNETSNQHDKIDRLSELTKMCTSPAELSISDTSACEERLLSKMKKSPRFNFKKK